MKLINMTFDQDVLPDIITVEMRRDEWLAIARLFGSMNSYAHQRLQLIYRPDESPFECLVDSVINRYWENGVNEIGPPKVEWDVLNTKPKEDHG